MAHGTDQAIFGLGADNEATDIAEAVFAEATQAELDAVSTVANAAAPVAAFRTTSLDGADETTPPGEVYTVTGMTATSVVLQVLFVSTKAAVATIEVLDPADFTPGADELTSTSEADRTNDQLIVTWLDI